MLKNFWFDRLYKLGVEYSANDQFEAASRCLRAACIASSDSAPAWQELALAQLKIGKTLPALKSIRCALKINPNSPRCLSIAALIGTELGHFDQAQHWIELAKQQEPDNPGMELIAADIFRLAEQWSQTEQALTQALDKGADALDVVFPRCELLRVTGHTTELAKSLENLLAEYPELPKARMMLADLQLSQCDYPEGWANHEYRLRVPEHPILRNYPWPYWQGEPLEDKVLLVYAEQGVGDEIMFASCLPDLLKIAKKILFVCDDRLAPLFKNSLAGLQTLSFPEVPNIAANQPESIDYCTAIGSLPLHFRRNASDFPIHNGYLRADETWIQPWREKLQTLETGLKIGIAWQGGLMRTGLRARSLKPEQLLPLLELPGIQFVNIQHGKVRRELEWLAEKRNLPVTTWPLDTKNMTELAGLVSALDLIITPCCSLVHLAGALGKPVWVMTPKVAAWRYLNEGETMPWYPSARLFRQPEAGDWASVIDAIKQQLIAWPPN